MNITHIAGIGPYYNIDFKYYPRADKY